MTYRFRLALSNDEWAKLRGEAARVNTSGAQLIERILQDVCAALPMPQPEPVPEPPPDFDSEELVSIE